MSSFNPLVPTGLVKLNTDYKNLQANMQQLDTSMSINHFAFSNGTASNGKHTFVEMVNNTAIPASTAAGEATLYSITTAGVSDIYMTPDASTNQYRLTNVNAAKFASFGGSSSGWVFLPGGLIMNYGASSSTSSGTINFSRAFTTILSIWANPTFGGSSPNGEATVAINQSNSSFNFAFVSSSGAYNGFYWAAIGLA